MQKSLAMKELEGLVVLFEKIEQVRVSERVRATHLAKRVKCLDCNKPWVPTKTRTACPKCASTNSEPDPVKLPFLTDEVLPRLESIEDFVEEELRRRVQHHYAWVEWGKRVRGISEKMVARMLGKIDIHRCQTQSAVWAHAGFGIKDGKIQKKRKGEVIDFDAKLQGYMTVVAESLMRARGSYYRIYLEQKRRALAAGLVKAHAHNRAFRHMIKLLLAHFYEVARRAEGLPVRPAYAFEYLGHTTYIAPEAMFEDAKPTVKRKRGKKGEPGRSRLQADPGEPEEERKQL